LCDYPHLHRGQHLHHQRFHHHPETGVRALLAPAEAQAGRAAARPAAYIAPQEGKGMKIVVYAICKNEEAFVERWMDSMAEADEIVVLDTGSTDGTVEALRRRGARVAVEAITPWRFDVARNRSLDLVGEDADICVCTDLDEVLRPGWRAALERSWTPDATQASYRYTWSFNADGTEGVVFWQEKIHARRGY